MSNYAALFVIVAIWLYFGRGLNLCLLIAAYYITFIITDITELSGVFYALDDVVYGTYAIQASVDLAFMTIVICLSTFYQKFIKLYLVYAAIIGTSLVLNSLMLYDQMIDLSAIYQVHSFRQKLSIPLDVLFAVLGSAWGGQAYISHSLHHANSADYNRSHSHYSLTQADKK